MKQAASILMDIRKGIHDGRIAIIDEVVRLTDIDPERYGTEIGLLSSALDYLSASGLEIDRLAIKMAGGMDEELNAVFRDMRGKLNEQRNH